MTSQTSVFSFSYPPLVALSTTKYKTRSNVRETERTTQFDCWMGDSRTRLSTFAGTGRAARPADTGGGSPGASTTNGDSGASSRQDAAQGCCGPLQPDLDGLACVVCVAVLCCSPRHPLPLLDATQVRPAMLRWPVVCASSPRARRRWVSARSAQNRRAPAGSVVGPLWNNSSGCAPLANGRICAAPGSAPVCVTCV